MSQCGACAHYRSTFSAENVDNLPGPFCVAFPSGIPGEVFGNQLDHRQPVTGDHGVRWESRDGAEFPEYAFPADAIGRGSA